MKLQLQLVDAGCIVEGQEIEKFKSKSFLQNGLAQVKLEEGSHGHSRLLELRRLLEERQSSLNYVTKTSCALRSAIIHATVQVPTSKRCIHCKQTLRKVRYLHRKLVCYVNVAEIKTKLVLVKYIQIMHNQP